MLQTVEVLGDRVLGFKGMRCRAKTTKGHRIWVPKMQSFSLGHVESWQKEAGMKNKTLVEFWDISFMFNTKLRAALHVNTCSGDCYPYGEFLPSGCYVAHLTLLTNITWQSMWPLEILGKFAT